MGDIVGGAICNVEHKVFAKAHVAYQADRCSDRSTRARERRSSMMAVCLILDPPFALIYLEHKSPRSKHGNLSCRHSSPLYGRRLKNERDFVITTH